MRFLRKDWFWTTLNLLFIIGIVICVYYLSEVHEKRVDLTKYGEFSLSKQTKQVLAGLKKDIEIWAFPLPEDRAKYRTILENYASFSSHIKYHIINPERDPLKVKELGVENYGEVVLVCGDKKVTIDELEEAKLTNAIIKVARDKKVTVAFLIGHGEADPHDPEKDGGNYFAKFLTDRGYEVVALNLFKAGKISDDIDVLVIAGPKKAPFEGELKQISGFLGKGKPVFLMLDPQTDKSWIDWAKTKGICFSGGVIVDPASRIFSGGYVIPVATRYPTPEVTKDLNLASFFPIAQAVSENKEYAKALRLRWYPVAETSKLSWIEMTPTEKKLSFDPKVDKKGPLTLLGVLVGDDYKFAGCGDSDFIRNAYVNIAGNGELAFKVISYLVGDEDVLNVQTPKSKFKAFYIPLWWGKGIVWVSLAVVPGLFILIGVAVWWIRRRR